MPKGAVETNMEEIIRKAAIERQASSIEKKHFGHKKILVCAIVLICCTTMASAAILYWMGTAHIHTDLTITGNAAAGLKPLVYNNGVSLGEPTESGLSITLSNTTLIAGHNETVRSYYIGMPISATHSYDITFSTGPMPWLTDPNSELFGYTYGVSAADGTNMVGNTYRVNANEVLYFHIWFAASPVMITPLAPAPLSITVTATLIP